VLPRAVLVAVEGTGASAKMQLHDSLAELHPLVDTAGATPVATLTQRLGAPHPHSYLQSGKLQELRHLCQDRQIAVVIADDELTPGQQRALEQATDLPVLDRTAVILDIFARHAQSRDGSLQVELAQLRYTLPRLTSTERTLSRLAGGIGTRGPGESRLETDRRRVKARMGKVLRETEELAAQRRVHRRWRTRQAVETVALVGYTNAGKSSLLNRLTAAGVTAMDQPFATLDPTTRQLDLPGRQRVLITDTVGFIQKLPADLAVAFKATLEEVVEADVLLHVVDLSHPHYLEHALVCYQELENLGAIDRPMVTALNKVDRLQAPIDPQDLEAFPNPVLVSAATGEGLDSLTAALADALAGAYWEVTVHIPFRFGRLAHLFRERGTIEHESFDATGTTLAGRLPQSLAGLFRPFQVARPAS
jgi:GTP-binding protein HflX